MLNQTIQSEENRQFIGNQKNNEILGRNAMFWSSCGYYQAFSSAINTHSKDISFDGFNRLHFL